MVGVLWVLAHEMVVAWLSTLVLTGLPTPPPPLLLPRRAEAAGGGVMRRLLLLLPRGPAAMEGEAAEAGAAPPQYG